MGYRHPNPRLVKVHRNYSVEDIARLFGIHKNTVRSWLKQGLAAIDDRRPMLSLGRELSRFLHERRQRAKQSCGPGRVYCIACRAPKVPAGKIAECTPTGSLVGNLCGICPDCDRLIYRRVNLAKIDAVRGDLEITFTRPHPRLVEAGHDPSTPLEAYRGTTLCLRVRSIGAGARLTVREGPDGKPHFATYRPAPDGRQSCGGQPPTRLNAPAMRGRSPKHVGAGDRRPARSYRAGVP